MCGDDIWAEGTRKWGEGSLNSVMSFEEGGTRPGYWTRIKSHYQSVIQKSNRTSILSWPVLTLRKVIRQPDVEFAQIYYCKATVAELAIGHIRSNRLEQYQINKWRDGRTPNQIITFIPLGGFWRIRQVRWPFFLTDLSLSSIHQVSLSCT